MKNYGQLFMFSKRLKRLKQAEDYRNFLASPEIIEDSHKRCRERKLDACLTQLPRVVNGLHVEELLESSRSLLNAARPIIKEDLYRNFTNEDQIIILCNHEGYAVDLISSLKAIQLCFSMGLGLGTCFREEFVELMLLPWRCA